MTFLICMQREVMQNNYLLSIKAQFPSLQLPPARERVQLDRLSTAVHMQNLSTTKAFISCYAKSVCDREGATEKKSTQYEFHLRPELEDGLGTSYMPPKEVQLTGKAPQRRNQTQYEFHLRPDGEVCLAV